MHILGKNMDHCHIITTHPEGTLGNIDSTPANNDGMLDGLGGDVDTGEGAITVVLGLDINGDTICILPKKTTI